MYFNATVQCTEYFMYYNTVSNVMHFNAVNISFAIVMFWFQICLLLTMKNNQQRTAPLHVKISTASANSTDGQLTEELNVTTLGRENSELKVCVKPMCTLSAYKEETLLSGKICAIKQSCWPVT